MDILFVILQNLHLRDQDYGNMVIYKRKKVHCYCYYDKRYQQFKDMGGLVIQRAIGTDILKYIIMEAVVKYL